jgi:hypothetical protein
MNMSKIKDERSKITIAELPQSSNGFLRLAFCTLTFALLFAGCEREYEQEEVVLALGPDIEATSVSSDYAARAIDAAGGLGAWTKTKELHLDGVVTLYQPDGSYHLTEQRYAVYPWSNSIQISASEPQGSFLWQLLRGQLDVLQGSGQIDELPTAVGSRCFAELILNITTVPARLQDGSAEFAKQGSAIKRQGQWYYAIDRRSKPGVLTDRRLAKAVFYQDRDSSVVDMIWSACARRGKFLAVRGYDYDEVEKGGVLVPARIEIFSADARGNLQKRLVKIDCHTLGRAQ